MKIRVGAVTILACSVACSSARPPGAPETGESKDGWTTIARGDAVIVDVERMLYEQPGSPHFYVHVRVTNTGQAELGLDLRRSREVFYPNQWGASSTEHRGVVDERRVSFEALSPPALAAIVADHHAGALTPVAPGGKVDYFEAFNASGRADVDAQSASQTFVIVAMDGALKVSDGSRAERVVPSGNDAERDVAVRTPIPWRTIPAGARVLAVPR